MDIIVFVLQIPQWLACKHLLSNMSALTTTSLKLGIHICNSVEGAGVMAKIGNRENAKTWFPSHGVAVAVLWNFLTAPSSG